MDWRDKAAISVLVAVLAICGIGMYSTWSACSAAGGVTVRGLFGLECIK